MEGAGVTVHRSLGTAALKNLDPFLMLDHFSSDDPDDYIAGFPDHPHRGFITFTYMLDGNMQHRDSMGNEGNLRAGGAQWMKAASGVIHSEMPKQVEGMMRGFQLWINLPAAEKMSAPEYQEYNEAAFPVVRKDDHAVKVIIGAHADHVSPIHDPHTQVQYYDVSLKPDTDYQLTLPPGRQGFVYLFEGSAEVDATPLVAHHLLVMTPGQTAMLKAGSEGLRFIEVSGQPLAEPIVQYGPFVMNTREEIEQSFADYRDGKLVRDRAEVSGQ
jgi:redox-sensitive bicupin YhaK (pirin superfamily)